jgi:hypothetical protein
MMLIFSGDNIHIAERYGNFGKIMFCGLFFLPLIPTGDDGMHYTLYTHTLYAKVDPLWEVLGVDTSRFVTFDRRCTYYAREMYSITPHPYGMHGKWGAEPAGPQAYARMMNTLFKVRCIHYTLYTIHYTLYTIHYTLYTIHYTLMNTLCKDGPLPVAKRTKILVISRADRSHRKLTNHAQLLVGLRKAFPAEDVSEFVGTKQSVVAAKELFMHAKVYATIYTIHYTLIHCTPRYT